MNKKFKQAMPESGDAGDITHQTEEERKKLEANDQRLLSIYCNTVLINKVRHTVVMDNGK